MNKLLGVIGGAGVAATNILLQLVEMDYLKSGAYRDAHQPPMIIYQATQVPSRSMFLEGKGESFIPGYIKIAQQLESIGATALIMNCNTAHSAYEEIQNSVSIPLINLVEGVASEVITGCYKKVGICGSDGLRISKIYDNALKNYDIEVIYPEEELQNKITKGICKVKSYDRNKPDIHLLFKEVVEEFYLKYKVDVVVLACTDIGVVYFDEVLCIDSLKVMKDLIIDYYE